MYADPQLELVVRLVPHFDGLGFSEQRYRHPGNLSGVEIPVPHGQPRHDHVGVSDGLHLVELGNTSKICGGKHCRGS